jgi:hypothetical protein
MKSSQFGGAFGERHCSKPRTCTLLPPRVVARTPLTSGRTCGTSCRLNRPLVDACVWRCMWTPLMQTRFSRTACPGSWMLSPSCRAVPAPGVIQCAPLLPPLIFWLTLLWRTTLCLRARVCSLLGSCVALCPLLRCPLCLVLLGVAPFRSAPPRGAEAEAGGRAWSPIWFFLPLAGSWERSHCWDLDARNFQLIFEITTPSVTDV